jgi:hypothetical protein
LKRSRAGTEDCAFQCYNDHESQKLSFRKSIPHESRFDWLLTNCTFFTRSSNSLLINCH